MLDNFLGVLPILTPPLCALTFIMCSKSNPLVVFALDLMSAYEGEHTIQDTFFKNKKNSSRDPYLISHTQSFKKAALTLTKHNPCKIQFQIIPPCCHLFSFSRTEKLCWR
jgi:hypothetical protein